MTNPIVNYTHYNSEMRKGLYDKLFFLNHIPNIGLVIDFGCADGSLIEAIKFFRPDITCIGYDNDPHMIELARTRFPGGKFASEWPEVDLFISTYKNTFPNHNIVLNYSSVLHELANYDLKAFNNSTYFLRNAYGRDATHITIRDMYFKIASSDTPSYIHFVENIHKKYGEEYSQFILSGSYKPQVLRRNPRYQADCMRNLVQFLMKVHYRDNWEREVQENYFAISDLHPIDDPMYFPEYRRTYLEFFMLPHFREELKELGYDPTNHITTHVKLILESKG